MGVTNGVLDSVTITGGREGTNWCGAGAYIVGCSNVTLSSCIVSNNGVLGSGSTYRYGGGIYAALNSALG